MSTDNISAEARLMEPLYRAVKVVEQKDETDAKILASLVVQYIIEKYKDQTLTLGQMRAILQKTLLYYKNGSYYASYLSNELQVQLAQWFTVLAADLPLTIGQIGEAMDEFAQWLQDKDALELKSEDVLAWFLQKCTINAQLLQRAEYNAQSYRMTLREIMEKKDIVL